MFENLMCPRAMIFRVIHTSKRIRDVATVNHRSGLIAFALLSVCAAGAQQSDRETTTVSQPSIQGKLPAKISVGASSKLERVALSSANGGREPVRPGSGSLFFPVVGYGSGLYTANSIAIADLNGDGKPDLAVMRFGTSGTVVTDGSVEIFLGNGDGTFQSQVAYDSGGVYGNAIAVRDLNGDGKPDIVVLNGCQPGTWGASCSDQGVVGILLGNGDGTFRPVVPYNSGGFAEFGNGSQVTIADVNGDGKPDIVVANCGLASLASCGSGVVAVLLGNGDGTFQPAVGYNSGGYDLLSAVVADVNGDGKPDIVAVNYCGSDSTCSTTGSVAILLGNGNGTFQPAIAFSSGSFGTTSVAVKDINGDGKPDVVVGGCENGGCDGGEVPVIVFLGNGDGTFQPPTTYPAISVWQLEIADVNGDGKQDIVVAEWGGFIGILLGNGDGTFQTAQSYGSDGQYPDAVAVADLNADGWLDVVAGNSFAGTFGDPVGVLLNAGTHIFTSTTITSSLDPAIVGQPITFTASVSSNSGTPTGSVIFSEGSTTLGTVTLVNGVAALATSTLPVGSYSVSAVYQGSGNFWTSSASLTQTVTEPPTTTSLVSSVNPAVVNQVVTYTATVTNQTGQPITGIVSFYQDGTLVATPFVVNNRASYGISYGKIGHHVLEAEYMGDSNNNSSYSPQLVEDIATLPVASKTAVSTSSSPAILNQPVTFNASVTWAYGKIPNGEVVTFYDGTTAIGTGITAGGVAALTTSTLSLGTHTIEASYPGDSNFAPSSGTVEQVVKTYPTTTTLSSTLDPSNYGQAVTLTAEVTSTGNVTPTGTITFKNGATSLGTLTLSGTGAASLTTTKMPVGTNSLTASYNGDSLNSKSTSAPVTQAVKQAQISMTLTSTPNPTVAGKQVKFTATLTSNGGLPISSGNVVTFVYNGQVLGTHAINNAGVVTLWTSVLPQGSDLVTATYAGNSDYSSAEASVTQVVQ